MPATRTYGMDQVFIPGPTFHTPCSRWPGNARVGFAVIVNLEL